MGWIGYGVGFHPLAGLGLLGFGLAAMILVPCIPFVLKKYRFKILDILFDHLSYSIFL
jgi:hypothetical protein